MATDGRVLVTINSEFAHFLPEMMKSGIIMRRTNKKWTAVMSTQMWTDRCNVSIPTVPLTRLYLQIISLVVWGKQTCLDGGRISVKTNAGNRFLSRTPSGLPSDGAHYTVGIHGNHRLILLVLSVLPFVRRHIHDWSRISRWCDQGVQTGLWREKWSM